MAPSSPRPSPRPRAAWPPHDVAVLVGSRVAAFELGIICQVFGLDRSDDGLPRYDFALCGTAPGVVPTTSGFPVVVPHGVERLATADLVVVPAWPGADDADPVPEPALAAVRDAVGRGARLLTVCTGAYVAAAAGLLDGRRAATHWQYAPRLARAFPQVRVDPTVLYVEDGPVTTSAGAAAGIDAALHVVRRAHGADVAAAVARRMVVPPQRSGGQAQFVETPVPVTGRAGDLAPVLDWAVAHLDRSLTVNELARRAGLAPRTFARRFRQSTGATPHRWLTDRRVELAERLLETTDLPVDVVARRAGLGGPDTLRHHLAARRGTTPTAYRAAFRTR